MKQGKKHDENALIFKDFTKAPIFGVTAHQNEVEGDGWVWKTGVVTPFEKKKGITEPFVLGLTIEHAEIMFALMTFQPSDYHFSPNPIGEVKFSMKKLCEVAFGHYNKAIYTKVCCLMDDLTKCWGSVYYKESQETHYFRVLKNITIIGKPSRRNNDGEELWLDNVVLHESYQELLNNLVRQMMIDISMFRQVTLGSLAKAIYMYIPSRAVHRSKHNPFKIKLATLFEQVGYNTSKSKRKGQRYQVMTRGKKSIIEQLNGVAVYQGKMFCSLQESADGADWMLCAWVQKDNLKIEPKSSTESFFKKTLGFTDPQWAVLVDKVSQYDWDERQEKNLSNWMLEGSNLWQFKLYAVALGYDVFTMIIASESDGEAGIGAMINKFKKSMKVKYAIH